MTSSSVFLYMYKAGYGYVLSVKILQFFFFTLYDQFGSVQFSSIFCFRDIDGIPAYLLTTLVPGVQNVLIRFLSDLPPECLLLSKPLYIRTYTHICLSVYCVEAFTGVCWRWMLSSAQCLFPKMAGGPSLPFPSAS